MTSSRRDSGNGVDAYFATEADVIETLTTPDRIEGDRYPPVAQRAISDRHVLRVVYRTEGEDTIVITFYPGRRQRYED